MTPDLALLRTWGRTGYCKSLKSHRAIGNAKVCRELRADVKSERENGIPDSAVGRMVTSERLKGLLLSIKYRLHPAQSLP
jgi:hypothetical protein